MITPLDAYNDPKIYNYLQEDVLMRPYFTVIVPIYQCERFIGECLGSLLEQTFGDFEVICVDDASTDCGMQRAQETASDDRRFSFFSLSVNSGQSAARNFALERAKGKIIVLLDADDYLEPKALEKIAGRFETQQLDDLYFNAESFYEDAESYRRVVEDFSRRPSFDGVATGMELFTFFEQHGQFMPHGALRAVGRSLLESNNIRFKEGIIHEDLLFTLQTLVLSKRSSFLNEPLYRRRIHTGSTMGTKRRSMRNIEGHLISIRFLRNWIREQSDLLDPAFMAAAAHRIEDYLNLCAQDYFRDVTEDEKLAYLSTLSPAERFEFELDVAQRAALLEEVYESKTYRAGKVVTAVPRAIRDGLSRTLRKR